MRTLKQISAGAGLAAIVTLTGSPAIAQTCDYQIVSASWSPHPSPDSIYVNFAADVSTDITLSPDPLNPTQFPMTIKIPISAVIENPWAGQGFVEDLNPGIAANASDLGALLAPAVLDALGEPAEAYGKAGAVRAPNPILPGRRALTHQTIGIVGRKER